MSVVGAEVHNALGPLLSALSSSDNAIRSQAEDQLNNDWVAQRPEVLLMGLVEQMQDSQTETVSVQSRFRERKLTTIQTRSFAAVLFRRIAAKPNKAPPATERRELFLTLSQAHKEAIQTKLLQVLPNEKVAQVRHKIGYAVAEVGRQYCDEGRSSGMAYRAGMAGASGSIIQC